MRFRFFFFLIFFFFFKASPHKPPPPPPPSHHPPTNESPWMSSGDRLIRGESRPDAWARAARKRGGGGGGRGLFSMEEYYRETLCLSDVCESSSRSEFVHGGNARYLIPGGGAESGGVLVSEALFPQGQIRGPPGMPAQYGVNSADPPPSCPPARRKKGPHS